MAVISSFHYHYPGELRSHAHPHAHILLPLEEPFYIRFENQEHLILPNQIGFVPPGVFHYYSCAGRAITLNIPAEMIKTPDLVYLTENSVRDIDEKLSPLIALIRQETEDEGQRTDSLRYLFYYLYDKLVEQGRLSSLKYMEENYASEITIRDLAALENYNVSYYTEWFKKNVGCLPSEYLRKIRIEKAKEILATTRYRIIDVALQVGYYNSSSFTRAFREVEGMTPNQYRQKIKKTAGSAALPEAARQKREGEQ